MREESMTSAAGSARLGDRESRLVPPRDSVPEWRTVYARFIPDPPRGLAQPAEPPVRLTKALQEGFGVRFSVKSPVWLNQTPPGRSRHEYQTTPAIFMRFLFFASSPKVLRR